MKGEGQKIIIEKEGAYLQKKGFFKEKEKQHRFEIHLKKLLGMGSLMQVNFISLEWHEMSKLK